MIPFPPVEASSEEEVIKKLDELYTPTGYRITKWKERPSGIFFRKTIHSAEGYVIREEKSSFQKNKEELLSVAENSRNDAYNKQMEQDLKKLQSDMRILLDRSKTSAENQWDSNVYEIRSLLEENDFTPEYINDVCTRIHEEMTQAEVRRLETLKERVVDWIAADIQVAPSVFSEPKGVMKFIVIVGPTGSGKTTSIAKMAASFARNADFVLFSIDNYKVGAIDQITKYANLLDHTPLSIIRNPQEMKMRFLEASAFGRDLVFVDTPGFSPTHHTLAAEVRTLLEPCKAEAYSMLLLPAYTRFSDMVRISKEFDPFDCKGVVFTKFDESSRVGTVISFMKKTGKPALFFTTGQNPASDIETATKEFLLNRLIGFGAAGQFR